MILVTGSNWMFSSSVASLITSRHMLCSDESKTGNIYNYRFYTHTVRLWQCHLKRICFPNLFIICGGLLIFIYTKLICFKYFQMFKTVSPVRILDEQLLSALIQLNVPRDISYTIAKLIKSSFTICSLVRTGYKSSSDSMCEYYIQCELGTHTYKHLNTNVHV
jgi:hypothetical protein